MKKGMIETKEAYGRRRERRILSHNTRQVTTRAERRASSQSWKQKERKSDEHYPKPKSGSSRVPLKYRKKKDQYGY